MASKPNPFAKKAPNAKPGDGKMPFVPFAKKSAGAQPPRKAVPGSSGKMMKKGGKVC